MHRGIPLSLAVILAVAAPAAAIGLPEQVHASVAGERIGIVWARAGDVAGDVEDGVRWWSGQRNGSVATVSEAYVSPGTTVFTAELPWPDTPALSYQVGSDRHGWSARHELHVPDDAWRFAAFGDHGTGEDSNASLTIVGDVLAHRPHAVLHLGDLSYANGHAPTWDAWFRLIEPLASQSLYMAAPGNHEHEGYYAASDPDPAWATDTASLQDPYRQFTARFHFGADDLRYSFDAGPVHVSVINTEGLCAWQPAQHHVPWRVNPTCDVAEDEGDSGGVQRPGVPGSTAPPDQGLIDWLRADLDAHPAPWNFVIFHQPVYSSGAYDGRTVLQEHYVPLFQEFGVDLVMAGHDHNYQRSFPLLDHQPAADGLSGYGKDAGPVYVVSGGGGDGVYSFSGPTPEWTAVRNATYHYLVIDVDEAHIRVQAIETGTGAVLDAFTIGAPPTAQAPPPDDVKTPWPLVPVLGLVAAAWLRRRQC